MILDFEMVNSGMGKGIKKTFPNFGNRKNEKKMTGRPGQTRPLT